MILEDLLLIRYEVHFLQFFEILFILCTIIFNDNRNFALMVLDKGLPPPPSLPIHVHTRDSDFSLVSVTRVKKSV